MEGNNMSKLRSLFPFLNLLMPAFPAVVSVPKEHDEKCWVIDDPEFVDDARTILTIWKNHL